MCPKESTPKRTASPHHTSTQKAPKPPHATSTLKPLARIFTPKSHAGHGNHTTPPPQTTSPSQYPTFGPFKTQPRRDALEVIGSPKPYAPKQSREGDPPWSHEPHGPRAPEHLTWAESGRTEVWGIAFYSVR
ncbi:hypothetical protein CC86DRAFT_385925 [Ophiobolus disseminans]|uniref:Uncharacterized protein n=1 Tax=Ophiobolus disseminans TaxID=1469910 RepID=A0A6A6ZPL8_9PLEO|nr:hypothetical protein CC86DRAFT_385925 [Ophiobolus disseminans]